MKSNRKMMMILLALALGALAGCAVDAVDATGAAGDAGDRSVVYTLQPWENLKATWGALNWTETTYYYEVWFTGAALVRDLAYNKQVVARWTTNGWRTWTETPLTYSFRSGSTETWSFITGKKRFPRSGPQVGLTTAVKVNFDWCLRYTVNGQTYWDNNGGANYHLDQNVRSWMR